MKQININDINRVAVAAGKRILEVYGTDNFQVETKDDESPLTVADRLSHESIVAGLEALDLGFPILSEEGDPGDFEARKGWATFWCVDPLDGTKEFVKRNGEFTVNIALIDGRYPVLGVIYVPVADTLYYADAQGAFMKVGDAPAVRLKVQGRSQNLVGVGSRSHSSEAEVQVMEMFGVTDTVSKGSSLKFCMVAEGKADVYFRKNPTMEWDTAAGQAVVEGAGGVVLNKQNERFHYNKEVLRNDSFLCLAYPGTDKPWHTA
jgi:3'(2'), 5'-bisphosphate nucleotidase